MHHRKARVFIIGGDADVKGRFYSAEFRISLKHPPYDGFMGYIKKVQFGSPASRV
ncbi:hypothetical protein PC116_g33050 [Phytophthora cactorum]|nr:hypothetical protein PC116_g33050 [Phytophthora cactorum]